VEQELPTLPGHMGCPPVFGEVRVTRSLVLCVMFCRSLFVFSGVHVTRSLVLCVCFVDRCLFLVGFVLLVL
jgi:hypothetical protein